MSQVLLVQFVIAQSPDKMKGLVIGILITSAGTFSGLSKKYLILSSHCAMIYLYLLF